MTRSSKQEINKDTSLKRYIIIGEPNWYLQVIPSKCRTYTFFSSAYGTLSRTDQILGHKSRLGKVKRIEIISSIFSDNNYMRVGIYYRKKKIC